jgi:hypothetical protein
MIYSRLLIAMLLASGIVRTPQGVSLIGRSVRLTRVAGLLPFVGDHPRRVPYAWYNKREVLAFTAEGDADIVPYMIDARTGARRLCSQLDRLMRTGPDGDRRALGVPLLSPDRRWVLFENLRHDNPMLLKRASPWFAAKLDGTKYVEISPPIRSSFGLTDREQPTAWTSDSSGWCILNYDGRSHVPVSMVYHIETGGYSIISQSPFASRIGATWTASTLGTTPDGRAIASLGEREGQVTILEYGWRGSTSARSRATVIGLPRGAYRKEMALSPDGKHIAWVFVFNYYPAHHERIELWISGLHGERMRKIGQHAVPDDASNIYYERPQGFAWLPDQRGISFLYNDSLYVLRLQARERPSRKHRGSVGVASPATRSAAQATHRRE